MHALWGRRSELLKVSLLLSEFVATESLRNVLKSILKRIRHDYFFLLHIPSRHNSIFWYPKCVRTIVDIICRSAAKTPWFLMEISRCNEPSFRIRSFLPDPAVYEKPWLPEIFTTAVEPKKLWFVFKAVQKTGVNYGLYLTPWSSGRRCWWVK
jgi:hypothetical protein